METPNNTLNGLLTPMADGTTLPDAIIAKYNSATQAYNYYTNSGGTWLPNGNATLNPGEGALLIVTNETTVTFAGLIPQGSLTNYLYSRFTLVSSQVPQAGGITTMLGYTNLVSGSSELLLWNGQNLYSLVYYNCSAAPGSVAGWYSGSQFDPAVLNVGEACFLDNAHTNQWIRNFPGCCGQ